MTTLSSKAVSRRTMLGTCIGSGVALLLGAPRRLLGAEIGKARYVLQLHISGALDPSYLLDARPLALTAGGKIANYLGTEPTPWTGLNGRSTYASSLTAPLLPFKERLTVINGVHMAPGFDGHEENERFLFSSSPFGGINFLQALVDDRPTLPFGYLLTGDTPLSRIGGARLSRQAATSLGVGVASTPGFDTSRVAPYLQALSARMSVGSGALAAGARSFQNAMSGTPDLAQRIPALAAMATGTTDTTSKVAELLPLAAGALNARLAHAVVLSVNGFDNSTNFDTHAPSSAKASPLAYAAAVEWIHATLQFLTESRAEAGDGSQSLLDLTTVIVTSEMGRTMRQIGRPIDDTGTDHNPLGNSILLAGAGIRPGLVIGETDLRAPGNDHEFDQVSKAHLSVDPTLVRTIGKPIDFATGLPRDFLPEVFDTGDYLSSGHVINTVLKAHGVPPERRLKSPGTAGREFPALDCLLA